ncbi:glycosyl hydrolase [Actinoplanes ianthinogenes]|uniref:Glycosyl hydrolase n=1 Tax=Actinoplanes ianthinogenes TaxID=122358 RepID=A0ABM7M2X4_9ACTN|nr:glycoside hydrolase family 88 protein [Actinoplanes ianthinogenes]BCJ45901.1 glycosyl hydrolase [Actinoplanes ianthinogenes]GGR31256.1 glycosyl hydrolase [Actinoplanes ianthinogenes]
MTAIDVTAAAVTAALSIIDGNLHEFGDEYPDDTTVGDRYPMRAGNVGWTTSFWPGMLWLAYDLTGDEKYLTAASGHVGSFAARVDGRVDVDTHDLGFLYTLSCVTAVRRTGNPVAKRAALAAADHLMSRVLHPAGIIQAWGDLRDPAQRGRTIIDSLMNTPLLFWAAEETGEHRYAETAWRHAAQLRDHILRPDGSTYHTFYWDPVSGEPLRGETEQGHADESCWARGQAWGVYGFLLNHRHTGDESFLTAARRCADYFRAHLPADGVPYWDLSLTGVERDSSAAAIAACGLWELGERDAAGRILGSLISDYLSGGNALLRHGVYDKPKGVGVDEGTLWGDYFYLEALTRVTRPGWTHPW